MKINEMFISLQGEGSYAGQMAYFIRFTSCNLACPYCDTDFGKVDCDLTVEEIVKTVKKDFGKFNFVVLTGGEPTLEEDFGALCEALGEAGIRVHVESNGTLPSVLGEFRKNISFLTISPKLIADEATFESMKLSDEIKFVYTEEKIWEWYLNRYSDLEHIPFYMQPCSGNFEPVVKFVKENPGWIISVQLHKVLNIK